MGHFVVPNQIFGNGPAQTNHRREDVPPRYQLFGNKGSLDRQDVLKDTRNTWNMITSIFLLCWIYLHSTAFAFVVFLPSPRDFKLNKLFSISVPRNNEDLTKEMISLRRRLLQGGKSYGPVCMSDSPIVLEILAMSGYGHMIIDHEHAPTDILSSQHMLQAMDAAAVYSKHGRTEPIIRLPTADTAYMKKVLDSMRLPGGVLVPMVEDAITAKKAVESTRYPRAGIRGCAVPFIRGSGWGSNLDYMRQCEEDLLVMVQVETPLGVEAIEEIAAVGGVDGIFLGPLDLSCSLGKMGQFNDPEVQSLISQAEKAILKSSCFLAGFRSQNRDLKEMFDICYSLICGSLDLGLLREASRLDVEAANRVL